MLNRKRKTQIIQQELDRARREGKPLTTIQICLRAITRIEEETRMKSEKAKVSDARTDAKGTRARRLLGGAFEEESVQIINAAQRGRTPTSRGNGEHHSAGDSSSS